MKVFFNTSLPRSGSTLIQAILEQNPSIYCSPTSAVIDLLYSAKQMFTGSELFKFQDPDLVKRGWTGFCREALIGYYSAITDRPFAIDKCRGWLLQYDWLKAFYPQPKMICCIRDLRSIIASMEKMRNRNCLYHDIAEDPSKMQMITIESRVSHWMESPPVGLTLNSLRDCLMKGHGDNIHFIIYEEFIKAPLIHLSKLYQYLELPEFVHNLDSIPQPVIENDAIHGRYGDHKIRNKLDPLPIDYHTILGDPICNGLVSSNKWFYRKFYGH